MKFIELTPLNNCGLPAEEFDVSIYVKASEIYQLVSTDKGTKVYMDKDVHLVVESKEQILSRICADEK